MFFRRDFDRDLWVPDWDYDVLEVGLMFQRLFCEMWELGRERPEGKREKKGEFFG
ncbi:hypothetical protein RchiOBHm_Chr7g0213131 [Rosa chinensis]|uniref:Uncharacterized protein n=1 Tax=Rosa chinensis TaxID=74649 RepID=A0A2P6PAX1_ROSCH|nr:hypothetical protein RchiOBHm_Chr7g0213131 [Rosa chinensis]